MKLTKRKGFNFFRSYYDVYNELDDKSKVEFMDALLDRQFLGVKPTELKGMAKFAYISQTNSIDSQVKGYEDKTKTKLLTTPTVGVNKKDLTPAAQVQEEEKEEVQEKPNIEARKVKFKNLLTPFLDEYGKQLLNDFFSYWTEHGDKDKKMRFEKERSYSVKRRLQTWKKNDFNNNKPKLDNGKYAPPVNDPFEHLYKNEGI